MIFEDWKTTKLFNFVNGIRFYYIIDKVIQETTTDYKDLGYLVNTHSKVVVKLAILPNNPTTS